MESPVATAVNRSHRKPLQPRNFAIAPAVSKKQTQQFTDVVAGKENSWISPALEASLAEELSAARRRRERLRFEKGKTERLLEERDNVIDNTLKEMERRADEQRTIELELSMLLRFVELSSSARVLPYQSLREREQEKKRTEDQCTIQVTDHVKEKINAGEELSPAKPEGEIINGGYSPSTL